MSTGVAALVAEFEAAAKEAWQAEDALRTRMVEQLALLERRRAFAYRRMNLVRSLAGAAANGETEEAAAAAQRGAIRHELGWSVESDFHRGILDGLRPIGVLVWQSLRTDEAATPAAMLVALETFEAWFEATHGSAFYALFDQEVLEIPLVET
jgi:hypothetical protein